MGKWSTYRKRGSTTAAAHLGPPPAPVLDTVVHELFQLAQGADDTGGQCNLQYKEFEPCEWLPVASADWAAGLDWSLELETLPGFYRATEAGNGTAYVGTSAYSNVLEYAPP